MWTPPRRPASWDGFINLYCRERFLHRHCVKLRRRCAKIQRRRTPTIGRRFNCLVTSSSIRLKENVYMHTGLDQSTELTPVEKSKRQGSPGKLNVILHGVFAFDQAEDEIVAHIPNMGT